MSDDAIQFQGYIPVTLIIEKSVLKMERPLYIAVEYIKHKYISFLYLVPDEKRQMYTRYY